MSIWAIIPAKDPALSKSRLAPVRDSAERGALSLQLLERTLRVVAGTPGVAQALVVSAAAEPLTLARSLGALALKEAPRHRGPSPAQRDRAPLHSDHTVAAASAHAGYQVPVYLRGAAAVEYPCGGVQPQRRGAQTAPGPEAPGRAPLAARPPEPGLNAALAQAALFARQHGAAAVLIVPADLPLLTSAAIEDLIDALPDGPGIALAPDRHQMGTNGLLIRPPLALPFLFGPDSMARHLQAADERGLRRAIVMHPAFTLDLDTPEDLRLLADGPLRSEDRPLWSTPIATDAASPRHGRSR